MSGLIRLRLHSDSVVVALADQADEHLCQLADIVIHPAEPTLANAEAVARRTARALTGCAVIAVGVEGRGCLVHNTVERRSVVVPGSSTGLAALRSAVLGYLTAVQPAAS